MAILNSITPKNILCATTVIIFSMDSVSANIQLSILLLLPQLGGSNNEIYPRDFTITSLLRWEHMFLANLTFKIQDPDKLVLRFCNICYNTQYLLDKSPVRHQKLCSNTQDSISVITQRCHSFIRK